MPLKSRRYVFNRILSVVSRARSHYQKDIEGHLGNFSLLCKVGVLVPYCIMNLILFPTPLPQPSRCMCLVYGAC
jgi:hypothetical protein